MQLHTKMKKYVAAALVSLAVCIASFPFTLAQELQIQDAAVPPPANVLPGEADAEGVETLTRGPVHEAFATPTATDPKPNSVIAKKPPADIDEVPPDFRPEGAIWINGYWEWDAEVEDFLWISGLWRVPPPEMRWVPPYWTEADGGWQRVPGFWASTAAAELEYRPTPPDSLEVGPTSPAPADNYFYIPGSWSYYDTGFRWRTGYWSPYRTDWVWCPARWIWTPAGCLYQAGYWDHRPLVRAQMFAPVRFHSHVYLNPGYRYRPWCVVDSSRFFVHLWIGPRANCYYFGNYYGSHHSRYGYTPWCDWSYRSRRCYDPLWSWCDTHYRRQGIDYIGRCRGWNHHFDRHEHERPARNWHDQQRQIADAKLDPRKSQRVLTADLKDVVKRDDLPIRLSRLNDHERESVRKVSDDFKKLNVERVKVEREGRLARGNNDAGRRPDSDAGRGSDNDAGRGPRIDLSKAGDAKPGSDKSVDAKPDSGKVTRRLDELKDQLSKDQTNKEKGEAKKTARLKLPEHSAAIREVTRNSRGVTRVNEGGASGKTDKGDKKDTAAAVNVPSDNDRRPRISADRGKTTARSSVGGEANAAGSAQANPTRERGPSAAPERGASAADKPAGEKRGPSSKPAANTTANIPDRTGVDRGVERGNDGDRGRSLRTGNHPAGSSARASVGASASGPAGPELKPPKIDLPDSSAASSARSKMSRSNDGPARGNSPRLESPRIETPKASAPKASAPKASAPKASAPKATAPKVSAPKIETRSSRSGDGEVRGSQPRISLPLSSGPKTSAPKSSGPRIEARSSGPGPSSAGSQPRLSVPRTAAPRIESAPRPAPRIEAPRISAPRIEAPRGNSQSRSTPRNEGARSAPRSSGASSMSRASSRPSSSNSSGGRSMSRVESSRSSGSGSRSGSGGGSGNSRGRSRNRD